MILSAIWRLRMRVLMVDDDKFMCHGITQQLIARDIICDVIHQGKKCMEQLRMNNYEYDLIVLDLMLPDINGLELLQTLRRNDVKVPVLILSSIGDISDKVQGLNLGADDYLVKPFGSEELFARMDALIRRAKGHADSIIKVGDLNIDTRNKTAHVCGVKLDLTKKEYAILELLALHKGSTLHKEVFFSHLYGGVEIPEIKIIDVFVCKIRRKIAKILDSDPGYITTVWGRGYMMNDQVA